MVLLPRLKMIVGMLLAFFVSAILMGFVIMENDRPYISSQKASEDIQSFQQSVGTNFGYFVSSLTQPFQSFIASRNQQSSSAPEIPDTAGLNAGSFNLNTISGGPLPPQSSSYSSYSSVSSLRPTIKPVTPTRYQSSSSSYTLPPTQRPNPTKTPKPTKVPKPTEVVYPPITTDVRPGNSLEEIMREVEKRACVPYRFLMAIRTKEGGNWFNNMSASTTKMYNTLGWWNSADVGTVCDGLAYWTQSGIIPPDSAGAGQRCEMAIGDQSYDQKIMGIMQVSESEQESAGKYIGKTIPGKFDRRVLFDNIMIFGIISKNRAGSFPQPSCTDWPQETVMEVARIHASGSTGSCNYTYSQNGVSGNYCKEIWDLYKSFK